MQKGIPVVIMDSPLKGEPLKDFVCTVSTNNPRAGEMAGEHLGKLLDGKGKVAILRYIECCASTGQRDAASKQSRNFPTFRQNNLAGSKKFVGFDTSPALVEGLKRGEIQALLFQSKDIQWSWVST